MRRFLVLVCIACAAVAGCSSAPPRHEPPRAARPAPVAAPVTDPGPRVEPTALSIPSVHISSTLVPLGLNPDGTVQVPDIHNPMQAGYYRLGPSAGQVGPFVVLGHVDSYTEAGVFYPLRDLREGDLVHVDRQDGSRITYVVDRIDRVSKDDFPTDEVYGDVNRPEIRLITCGGSFDRTKRSYDDNVIVFGHEVSGTGRAGAAPAASGR